MATASNSRIRWQQFEELPLDALPFPAAIVNRQTNFVSANPEWTATFADCLPGQPFQHWCSLIHPVAPDLAAALRKGTERVIADGERFTQAHGDGGRFLITVSPCRAGVLVLHQDLHPLENGRDLAQAQRMETVGRLMGGVVHDFANVLTLIYGYGDILINRIGAKDPLRSELEEILKAARHGASLTAQLLDFARGQNVESVELDLNALVMDMQRMLHPIIGEQVKLETQLAAGLRKIVADGGHMEQVVVNLILNARDAMPTGGAIRIRTANWEITPTLARLHCVAPGPAIILSVSDTGCGIDPADLARIFEPFFTTKEKGKGTGLGLSTVRDIVRANGGDIWVRSVPAEGADFTLCLPAVGQPARNGAGLVTAMLPEPGHETVLLVEDEDSVRRLFTHLLRSRGYQVLEASNSEDALCIFQQHSADIRLVLTDVIMPGISGPALAEKLREMQPELRIIFMSGYTSDVLSRTGGLAPGMTFLQKPLRPDVLTAKVREALDSPSRPFNPR